MLVLSWPVKVWLTRPTLLYGHLVCIELLVDPACNVNSLLRCVRVLGPLEHLEVSKQLPAQTVLGQHALHSFLQHTLRYPLHCT